VDRDPHDRYRHHLAKIDRTALLPNPKIQVMQINSCKLFTTVFLFILSASLPAIAQQDTKTYILKSQYFSYRDEQKSLSTYLIPCSLLSVFNIGKGDFSGDTQLCDRNTANFKQVIMSKPYKNHTGCTLVYADRRQENIGRCVVIDKEGREIQWSNIPQR
jgi:hypothetical protein